MMPILPCYSPCGILKESSFTMPGLYTACFVASRATWKLNRSMFTLWQFLTFRFNYCTPFYVSTMGPMESPQRNIRVDYEEAKMRLMYVYLWLEWRATGSNVTNPALHLTHTAQCTTQNKTVHISVLSGALWDMEQLHCGICEIVSVIKLGRQ